MDLKPSAASMAPISVSSEGKKLAKAIGTAIRARRKLRGWSQEALAERSNLHPNQIGFLERGDRIPNVQTLHQVAVALKVKLSDLLRDSNL